MTLSGPLAGILVVDLTRVLAGPYCTMVLSDLGARVIKVEQPGKGDDSRAYGPFIAGQSGYFAAMNRGKESIALDLKSADDRAILERLSARRRGGENFRPGTMGSSASWETHKRYPVDSRRSPGTPGPIAHGPPTTWSHRRWVA
jgi:CoA:oxalate CoA-transferase